MGTLRGILKRARLWARIRQDDEGVIPKLPDRDDVGMCLTREQELTLLAECAKSRSRGLYTLVVVALTTGMRAGELRGLRWGSVDLESRVARVGHSKTAAGEGRPIALNDRALTALRIWANKFPDRKSQHFVFPSERYGVAGNDADPHAHTTNTKRQMNSWRTAWETARENAGLTACRFHDLRHTVVTRLLEGRTAFATVAAVVGWSASTTQKMAKRYGHICDDTQRVAMNLLELGPAAGKVGDTKSATTETRAEEQKAVSA